MAKYLPDTPNPSVLQPIKTCPDLLRLSVRPDLDLIDLRAKVELCGESTPEACPVDWNSLVAFLLAKSTKVIQYSTDLHKRLKHQVISRILASPSLRE